MGHPFGGDGLVASRGTSPVVSARLPATTASVAEARALVASALRDARCHHLVETAELLVSELAGNAVVHAGGEMQVSIRIDDDRVRVEVTDSAPGRPMVLAPTEASFGGRGLQIVHRLSSRWGVDTHDVGKTVWFELPKERRLSGSTTPTTGATDSRPGTSVE